MTETEILKKRAEVYNREDIYACITTNEKKYYHGFILEIKEDCIILRDRKFGRFPIPFLDIEYISPSEQKPSKEELEERKK